jgi:23S rRNA pseudouridine1911/1915/1917 synthase
VKDAKKHHVPVPADHIPSRIDTFIRIQFPEYSRTFIQELIAHGHITLNDKQTKASASVKAGDQIVITIPQQEPLYTTEPSPEKKELLQQLPVEIVYQHPDFYIINKPAGLTTHKPAHNSTTLSLVDWLIFHIHSLLQVGNPERPGIVHRLDKDTSGLLIVARNNQAHHILSAAFKDRTIHKTYLALVEGTPPKTETIASPIGRHPIVRNKMATNGIQARAATTTYTVLKYFKDYTLLEVHPLTGRTHQIRVHLSSIGHPIIGDQLYGKKSPRIARHALHATRLQFNFKGDAIDVAISPPTDFQNLLEE